MARFAGQYCSSVYQYENEYLINYSHDNTLQASDAYIIGVGSDDKVMFEYQLPRGNAQCATTHNVKVIDEVLNMAY